MLTVCLISFILLSFVLIFLILIQSENNSETISSINNNYEKKFLSINFENNFLISITSFIAVLFFLFSLILSNISSIYL
ncbi:preprotein translocase subunit SecG [Buchnera aphidicola]|uniref:preprotein translocase subunit SecG n=1 Tax=Buchnera aphidicola TaxID=9 RepID=UPI0034646B01